MNMLSTAIASIALILALVSVFICIRMAQHASAVGEYAVEMSAKHVSVRKLAAIETQLTEHDDSINTVLASVAKLRSRTGMRELRAKQKEPATETDQEWKKRMRLERHLNGANTNAS